MRLLLAPGNTQGSYLIRESETAPGIKQCNFSPHNNNNKKQTQNHKGTSDSAITLQYWLRFFFGLFLSGLTMKSENI